jgi:hypothetical protein
MSFVSCVCWALHEPCPRYLAEQGWLFGGWAGSYVEGEPHLAFPHIMLTQAFPCETGIFLLGTKHREHRHEYWGQVRERPPGTSGPRPPGPAGCIRAFEGMEGLACFLLLLTDVLIRLSLHVCVRVAAWSVPVLWMFLTRVARLQKIISK